MARTTQAYVARRTREGLSKREIIRCLKRYIAREIYHAIRADMQQFDAPEALDDLQDHGAT